MQVSKAQGLRALGWVLALAAIAGAFVMYTRPDFMVQLSNQVWACF